MKKALTGLLIAAAVIGGVYYGYGSGRFNQWLPEKLYPQNVLPEQLQLWPSLTVTEDGRVSSDSEDAVFVDSVATLATLGSGNGLIQRYGGVVEPQETYKISTDSSRSVAERYVEVGDTVQAGDKLFTYDNTEYEEKLETAQIELESAKLDIESDEKQLEELKKIYAEKPTAQNQLSVLQAENSLKQKQLELEKKKKEIENIEDSLQNPDVTSEVTGVVQKINTSKESASDDSSSSMYYSYSSSGEDDTYITILKLGTYRVKASVNEQNIRQLSEGLSMVVYSRVDSSETWKGVIDEIKTGQGSEEDDDDSYNSSSAGSSSYTFYVELEDSEGLMLGQHVYLEQDLGQAEVKTGLWLDDYYLVEEDGKTYVWAVSSSNVLEKREVTIGDTDPDLVQSQIASGLTTDDYIALPVEGLTEGLPVRYGSADDSDAEDYSLDADDDDFDDDDDEDDDDEDDDGDADGDYDDAAYTTGADGIVYYDADAENGVITLDDLSDGLDDDDADDENYADGDSAGDASADSAGVDVSAEEADGGSDASSDVVTIDASDAAAMEELQQVITNPDANTAG